MADRTHIIEYKDFSGGDWGTREAWNAPSNSFSATNMLVYRTGELGVRPGVRAVTPTGAPTGLVMGINEAPDSDGVIYVQGNKTYWFDPSRPSLGLVTSAASFNMDLTSTVPAPTFARVGDVVFIISQDGVAQATGALTLARLSNAPAGSHGALFGEVFVVVYADLTLSNVEFSDSTAALNTWPGAVNTFDVGNGLVPAACYSQRSALQIMTNGGIYVVTGTLNADTAAFAVRKSSVRKGPQSAWASAQSVDDTIWYVEDGGVYPASFDGANFRTWSTIQLPLLTSESPGVGVATFEYPYVNDAVFLSPYAAGGGLEFLSTAWVHLRGVWTKHQFPATIDIGSDGGIAHGRMATYPVSFFADPGAALDSGTNLRPTTTFVMTDDGDSSPATAPVFWAWSPDLDRPGSETDLISTWDPLGVRLAPERAGDASDEQVSGSVSFPEWHAPDGSEVLVRTVSVDFRKWNTGGSLTNHFDVTVDSLRRYNGESPQSSGALAFDEAGSEASTGGTLDRRVFSFGDQGLGNGFQLHFTNCRGVAFLPGGIKVHAELRPAR